MRRAGGGNDQMDKARASYGYCGIRNVGRLGRVVSRPSVVPFSIVGRQLIRMSVFPHVRQRRSGGESHESLNCGRAVEVASGRGWTYGNVDHLDTRTKRKIFNKGNLWGLAITHHSTSIISMMMMVLCWQGKAMQGMTTLKTEKGDRVD